MDRSAREVANLGRDVVSLPFHPVIDEGSEFVLLNLTVPAGEHWRLVGLSLNSDIRPVIAWVLIDGQRVGSASGDVGQLGILPLRRLLVKPGQIVRVFGYVSGTVRQVPGDINLISWSLSNLTLDRVNKRVRGGVGRNIGDHPITIVSLLVTWVGSHKLVEVTADLTPIWSESGPGTPSGMLISPAAIDTVDYVLPVGGPLVEFTYQFNNPINNMAFNVGVFMSDGSYRTARFWTGPNAPVHDDTQLVGELIYERFKGVA